MFKELKKDYYANNKGKRVIIILFIYRLGNKILNSNINKFYKKILLKFIQIFYQIFVYFPFHIEIPFSCKIGGGFRLPHQHQIVLNGRVEIGENCTLYHEVTLEENEFLGYPNAPKIGNNVYIGSGAKVIGNIKIEDNCKIGANAIVVKDMKKGEVAVLNIIKNK